MPECATSKIEEEVSNSENCVEQYSSVEITNGSIDLSYHFKLWNIASESMCILVKEDSKILSRLKEGDRFNMKYYAADPLYPAEYRETAIQNIDKDDHGRFKGHYLVHLEILDNHSSEAAH